MRKKKTYNSKPKYLCNSKYFGSDDLSTVFIEIRQKEVVIRKDKKEYTFHPKNFLQMARKLNRYTKITKSMNSNETSIVLNPQNELIKHLLNNVIIIQEKIKYNGDMTCKINDQLLHLSWQDVEPDSTIEITDEIKSILFSEKLKEQDLFDLFNSHKQILKAHPEYSDRKVLQYVYNYWFNQIK